MVDNYIGLLEPPITGDDVAGPSGDGEEGENDNQQRGRNEGKEIGNLDKHYIMSFRKF